MEKTLHKEVESPSPGEVRGFRERGPKVSLTNSEIG